VKKYSTRRMFTEKTDRKDSPGVLYRRAAIMGVGLIGGSLALAFRRSSLVGSVIGVSSARTIGKALEMGVIDEGFTREQAREALPEADLVILSSPVRVILEQLKSIGPWLKPGATVTDVGSTKRAVIEAAKTHLPEQINFVGGHPMTGAESTGVEAADPFLFQNAMYVICPARPKEEAAAGKYCELVSAIGARVLVMSPERHDSIAAAISHLPQMVAVTLMNQAAGANQADPNTLKLAAGGFRDLTRIASSPFEIWRDICVTNRDEITRVIDEFIEHLKLLRRRVGSEELSEDFTAAASSRALIHKDAKGFISPLFEVVVTAPDEVGVIRRIATGLAEDGINIKDIEVLKVREGEGGTIMLGFGTQEERKQAKTILTSLGFPVRYRD
jgi:prephenate dehydrogenase